MKQIELQTVKILIGLLLQEQSDQDLHCFVSHICPKTSIFMVYNTLKIMHNILREKYLTLFLEVKKILAAFLEFSSNWLRLITLCENITLFWSSGPDSIMHSIFFHSTQERRKRKRSDFYTFFIHKG